MTEKAKILVVDDNPSNRLAIRVILKGMDAELHEAGNGFDALTMALETNYALILLDMQMPEMDGYEVCEQLRADARTADTPVIFLTAAYKETSDKMRGYSAGAMDYLTKPLDDHILRAKVHVFLRLYSQYQQLQEKNAALELAATEINERKQKEAEILTGQLVAANQYHQELQQVIKKQQQAEQQLIGFKSRLEEEVEQRTAELVLARNNAEAANIAKSTFIATMSHELRTPLNAILGFSELMSQDETLTAAQKETLSIINHSGAHLLSMINDVLDISKIEAGRLELDIQAFDLINLLGDIGGMINVRAINKQLSFSLEIASDVPQYIQADSGKLRQILINLLGNAIKFTQQGGIILRVHARPLPIAAMIMLTIEVTDSGAGIASDQQLEVFKPFVQLSPENSDVNGTGLGLAISKLLVELMGGSISVTSVLEVGSTFKFELPVANASADDITVEEYYRPVSGIAPDQPQWRLLVVDDNSDNRLLLVKLLTEAGFQVREAENGQEAVSEFEQWQPHLIWMDMRMPVMDGYEAAAKIRQLKGGHDVKIIALTASAFREQHSSIINAGCDALLVKPFHIPEIFATLTKNLGVKFIYRDNSPTSASIPTVTLEMLTKLPSELRQQLHEAALTLDTEETDAVIAQIRPLAPDVADALHALVQHYQFDQIIHLTKTD
ncbi:MAG: response regulator [Methylococcaceae bacterium]